MHLLKVPLTFVGALESPNLDICLSTYGCGQPSTRPACALSGCISLGLLGRNLAKYCLSLKLKEKEWLGEKGLPLVQRGSEESLVPEPRMDGELHQDPDPPHLCSFTS